MRRSAAVPEWLVLLGAAFVGWVLLRRFRGSRRLDLPLPAFKLTERRLLIHRLTHDPEVLEAVGEHARERGVSESVAMRLVERYACEIVPAFDSRLYFRVGLPLAGWLSRALYQISSSGDEELAAVAGDASVVFVMNHRSNMDYVILAHLLSERAALSFAAGEWARVWPLGPFVRAMGAFFVRRGSGDELYRRVLERFVQRAVEGGLALGVFPEGGLSRDGTLQEPRIGLLDYMLRRFDPAEGRDLIFVPVAINYDWVLEDESLIQAETPRSSGARLIVSTSRFVIRNLLIALRERRRLGHAAVGFGSPISAREYARSRNINFRALDREARAGQVRTLAGYLMRAIGELVPVVPVPAVAHILVEAPDEFVSEPEIESRVRRLISALFERDACAPPGNGGIADALRMLTLRRLVLEKNGSYRPTLEGVKVLRYYASSISHLLHPEEGSQRTGD
jgi:glycerol-3-phosphate O-acyltransferase